MKNVIKLFALVLAVEAEVKDYLYDNAVIK